jgi:hypothetical protein
MGLKETSIDTKMHTFGLQVRINNIVSQDDLASYLVNGAQKR